MTIQIVGDDAWSNICKTMLFVNGAILEICLKLICWEVWVNKNTCVVVQIMRLPTLQDSVKVG